MCRKISTSSRRKERAEAAQARRRPMEGRWEMDARFRDLEMAIRIADSSARMQTPQTPRGVRKEVRKHAAIRMRDRRPEPAIRARRRHAKAATTATGRSSRRCLRARLLSPEGRVNRPAGRRWAVHRWVVHRRAAQNSIVPTARLAVRAPAGTMVAKAADTAATLGRHST